MMIESPLGVLRLRPERPDDEAFRFALFCESRPDLALLPEPARGRILPMQFRAQALGYRAQFPQARYDIVELAGLSAGRIARDDAGGVLHLIDIALAAPLRGRGLGILLMRALMDEAKAAGRPMRLAVADRNPAVRLYLRLGFVAVDRRDADTVMEWRAPG